MSQLALSTLFEYLCYGSMAIINILLFQDGDRLLKSIHVLNGLNL